MNRAEFEIYNLNDNWRLKAGEITNGFSQLLDLIDSIVPAGRERALVVTKLQEACFWAKRSLAQLPENQAR